MADYKRKRRSGFKATPKINKKRINKSKDNTKQDIEMISQDKPKPKRNMRVVTGKKLERKRRFKIFSIIIGLLISVLFILELCIPAGFIETLSNKFATIGSGSYPITMESSNTINAISKGSYYYVLTNSNVEAYSSGGKCIFSYSHGFENPVLKTSETRALVFGQNSDEVLIFTLSGLESTIETKEKIKNAAIGDNGSYAIVTNEETYAAKVSVYEKNNDLVYEWFSSKDLVNNVAIEPWGDKIAVSTISSDVGNYNSKLLVLSLESSKPELEKNYENTVIYALDTSFGDGFSVITANRHDYVDWSDYSVIGYSNEYTTAMFRSGNDGMAVVYNRENDRTDNRIAVFSDDGEFEREIKFKGVITDFTFKDGHVYVLSDSRLSVLADDGSIMRSADCGFGVVRICPIDQSSAAVITDNAINEIKLEQE